MRGRLPSVPVFVFVVLLAGCLSESPPVSNDADPLPVTASNVFLHDGTGALLNALPAALADLLPEGFNVSHHHVGHSGPEPSLGVTSNGNVFFVALSDVLRSTDHGVTWEVVSDVLSSPTTLDPLLWVDPTTDRIYSDQLYVGCSWLSWSDDDGETWTTNPAACGLPGNDHQKLATGPFVAPLDSLPHPVYPNVVYYAYNALAVGGRVAVSFDGGLTFPVNSQTFLLQCDDTVEGGAPTPGGLHGRIRAGPDGTAYVPARNCEGPIVSRSFDNGATWEWNVVHSDIGTAARDKNPDLAIDVDNGIYLLWPGADNRLYYSASTDHGTTWTPPMPASAPHIRTATMPSAVAGDPGRVAWAYYATPDSSEAPDDVPANTTWDLYVTYTLDGLADNPTFVTVRVTPDDDPIQVGAISTNSGGAPAGSRNLLDFIDMVRDDDGRWYTAFADGCTEDCKLDDMNTSRDREGVVGILQVGPSLFAEKGVLARFEEASVP